MNEVQKADNAIINDLRNHIEKMEEIICDLSSENMNSYEEYKRVKADNKELTECAEFYMNKYHWGVLDGDGNFRNINAPLTAKNCLEKIRNRKNS